MSKAINYIENVSVSDALFGETLETVTVNEAIIACKIQELEMLTELDEALELEQSSPWGLRKVQLEKELRNIKTK